MRLRDATPDDLAPLSEFWEETWHEAHAAHVPAQLVAERNRDSFRIRLGRMLPDVRMAESPDGELGGFCAIKATGRGELFQIFVSHKMRGKGLGALLLSDGEARLSSAGFECPTLACLPQNTAAARFYSRQGWKTIGQSVVDLETATGRFPLTCLVFERHLGRQVS